MPLIMSFMLIEELDNSRVVTKSSLEVLDKNSNLLNVDGKIALVNTYESFQRGVNEVDFHVWGTRLFSILNEHHKINSNELESKCLVLFCRGSYIYADIVDKQINSKDACSLVSSLIAMNKMKLSCSRVYHDSYLN